MAFYFAIVHKNDNTSLMSGPTAIAREFARCAANTLRDNMYLSFVS